MYKFDINLYNLRTAATRSPLLALARTLQVHSGSAAARFHLCLHTGTDTFTVARLESFHSCCIVEVYIVIVENSLCVCVMHSGYSERLRSDHKPDLGWEPRASVQLQSGRGAGGSGTLHRQRRQRVSLTSDLTTHCCQGLSHYMAQLMIITLLMKK